MPEEELHQCLEEEWGFCISNDLCPVWVSEFGAKLSDDFERAWFLKLCRFLRCKDADFAYWPLNSGAKPGGQGEELYSILNLKWEPMWEDERLICLRELMRPPGATCRS